MLLVFAFYSILYRLQQFNQSKWISTKHVQTRLPLYSMTKEKMQSPTEYLQHKKNNTETRKLSNTAVALPAILEQNSLVAGNYFSGQWLQLLF